MLLTVSMVSGSAELIRRFGIHISYGSQVRHAVLLTYLNFSDSNTVPTTYKKTAKSWLSSIKTWRMVVMERTGKETAWLITEEGTTHLETSFQEMQPKSEDIHLQILTAHQYIVTLRLHCLRIGSIVVIHQMHNKVQYLVWGKTKWSPGSFNSELIFLSPPGISIGGKKPKLIVVVVPLHYSGGTWLHEEKSCKRRNRNY